MPYFQRKPYAQTVCAMPGAPHGAVTDTAATDTAATDIVDMAAAVLGQEMAAGAASGPFRLRGPLAPGQTGQMVLSLMPDDGVPPYAVRLASGDLVGPSGRIPAAQVRLDPAVVLLRSGQASDVRVTVAAPPGTAPGLYSGTLVSADDAGLSIRVEVPVRM